MGAPQGACSDGVPQHGVRPQSATAPFRVAISSDKVKGGERVSVQLSAVDSAGNPFIGFLLQARNLTSGEFSGRFYKQDSKDEYTLLNCPNLNVSIDGFVRLCRVKPVCWTFVTQKASNAFCDVIFGHCYDISNNQIY
jgi:hypothetical protein